MLRYIYMLYERKNASVILFFFHSSCRMMDDGRRHGLGVKERRLFWVILEILGRVFLVIIQKPVMCFSFLPPLPLRGESHLSVPFHGRTEQQQQQQQQNALLLQTGNMASFPPQCYLSLPSSFFLLSLSRYVVILHIVQFAKVCSNSAHSPSL